MPQKKVLFLDRDGTILVEPLPDKQVDSLEKLSFIPKVITSLARIASETDYELVMVTNQDGLGTESFREETFWPAHNKMLEILQGEGIVFSKIFIDRSFEHENLPTRKPGVAMLTEFFSEKYDLRNSYVIGDRLTDVKLAQNLGAKAILLADLRDSDGDSIWNYPDLITKDWEAIYNFLKLPTRIAEIKRKTNETDIYVRINLDGIGKTKINTGLGFFNHMLEQLGKHGNIDIEILVNGDLYIDEHHTVEDTALALGEAFAKAIGDKIGIERYGFVLPMDDALAQVAIDFSGRSWLVWDVNFKREKIGDVPTEMFYHFFKSFSDASKCNIHIKVDGDNEHHKIESIFKALGKAVKMAVKRDQKNNTLPSTKGVL